MKEPQITDALRVWKRIVRGLNLDELGMTPQQESIPIMNILDMMIEKQRKEAGNDAA